MLLGGTVTFTWQLYNILLCDYAIIIHVPHLLQNKSIWVVSRFAIISSNSSVYIPYQTLDSAALFPPLLTLQPMFCTTKVYF